MKVRKVCLRTIWFTVLTICTLYTSDAVADDADQPAKILKIDNGIVSVGLDRTKGGAITWLAWNEHAGNIVNIHDPGRLIQQSYYAGRSLDRTKDGQSPNWSPWAWNPIQGGGVSSWAQVIRFERLDETTLFAETIPKLWDMPSEEAQAVMRQWTGIEAMMPNVISVRNQIVCSRNDDDAWGPALMRSQEVPACYFIRSFDRFRSYLGKGKWRDEKQLPGPPWGRAKPPLDAMACFHESGLGVAVYSPTANEHWNFGPHVARSSDDPSGGPCVHMAPISRVLLGPKSSYEYRYWLIVGNAEQIAERLDALIEGYSDEEAVLKPFGEQR